MASTNQGDRPRAAHLRERLIASRSVLLAALVLLLGFVALGTLSLLYAVIGLAVLVLAALTGPQPAAWAPVSLPLAGKSPPSALGPLLEAIVASLSAPAIALDRDGRVLG